MLKVLTFALLFCSSTAYADSFHELTGKVTVDKTCKKDEITLWLSKGKELLYQSYVPKSGSFSFYLYPGEYEVVATDRGDCFDTKVITIKKSTYSLNLKLLKFSDQDKKRKPAASYGLVGGYCPTCMMYTLPFGSIGPWMNRQWGGFGPLMYSNFNYPCAWGYGGCAGNLYPGGGPLIMGKPNVYFSNVPSSGVNFEISLASNNRMISTVPKHQKTWKVLPGKKDFVRIDGVNYKYLHYDYRLFIDKLQSETGFCEGPKSLIPTLSNILKTYHFTDMQIKDFVDYFSQKVPPDEEYCVYPQFNAELSHSAELKLSPSPEQIIRINFVIVPAKTRAFTLTQFAEKPKEVWTPQPVQMKKGFVVREWGMGFLVGISPNEYKASPRKSASN